MTVLTVWYVWVCLGVLVLFHAASVFASGIFARIAGYLNILLHAGYIPVLLLASAPIEEAVLLYMISVLAYSFMSYLRYILAAKNKDGEGGDTP